MERKEELNFTEQQAEVQNRLILMGWFNPKFVQNELIPEFEENCAQYGIEFPAAYDIFQKNKFAENSMYFHHSYAESDIPMGQQYQYIALADGYKILADSVQACDSKIICFFTAYRSQPSECAMRGHHELGLIQFEQGIPQVIYDELFEIKDKQPFHPSGKQICLF